MRIRIKKARTGFLASLFFLLVAIVTLTFTVYASPQIQDDHGISTEIAMVAMWPWSEFILQAWRWYLTGDLIWEWFVFLLMVS